LKCKQQCRRYLDTKDANSTSNLRKHVKNCWSEEALLAAEDAKEVGRARENIRAYSKNGSITQAFARVNNKKVTYSTRQHTKVETRLVKIKYNGRVADGWIQNRDCLLGC
jgi:hypothetical protein